MDYSPLNLDAQLCFPIYSVSRLITKAYKPHLEKLGITYPQYLVMMVLWEKDEISVSDITEKLLLDTNTVSPLLKRMEKLDLIERKRSESDERKVKIKLSKKGLKLKDEALPIPTKLVERLSESDINIDELIEMKERLNDIIHILSDKKTK